MAMQRSDTRIKQAIKVYMYHMSLSDYVIYAGGLHQLILIIIADTTVRVEVAVEPEMEDRKRYSSWNVWIPTSGDI